MRHFLNDAIVCRLRWGTLISAASMTLMFSGSLVAADPGPYEVIFYQETNYTGPSDTYQLKPTQTYSSFRADDILATRHFIKSVKVGSHIGVMLGYDNYVAIAQPKFLNCPESRPNLKELNWYVLSVLVYNRDIVSYPEGAMFGNHPTSQPPSERREMFVLANQPAPPPQALARHGMRYVMLHGPASPAPPTAGLDKPAETRLTIMHEDSSGVISASVFGQMNQGQWQPHAHYVLTQSMDLGRIAAIQVTGSQRLFRQISDGDDKSPGMKVIGLPPPANVTLAPGGSLTDPLTPNISPGDLSEIKPYKSKWKSSLGVLSLGGTPTLISGSLTQPDGTVRSVVGWPSGQSVQLIIYNLDGKPIATGHFKESADGKTASGFWVDLPGGMPTVWKLDRDQS